MIISPDFYLTDSTTGEYVWSPERAVQAWGKATNRLKQVLQDPKTTKVVMMVGIPASGKSTWIRSNLEPGAIYFDATFTNHHSRSPIIAIAKRAGKLVEAVVMATPIRVCLDRNDCRSRDRKIPHESVQRMVKQLAEDPPKKIEGFDRIRVVRHADPAQEKTASVLTRTYYHATYLSDAEKIAKSGFQINMARGRGRIMGPAVYLTGDRTFAEGYAQDIVNDEEKDAGMLHLRIHVSKFLDVNPKTWPQEVQERYFKEVGREPDNSVNYPVLGDIARALGYEAAGSASKNVAVFNPKNIRVVKLEPYLP